MKKLYSSVLVLLLFVTAFLQTGVVIGQDILPSQILSRNKKAYTFCGPEPI